MVKNFFNIITYFFGFGFGSGFIPKAPGSFATAFSIPIYLFLVSFCSLKLYFLLCIFFFYWYFYY
ncbi:hypothetical protein CCU22_00010 [Candidatus Legionella polyplacis]|nr:hypothetical protein CCU22_00010 [Candidatus Legionella polyplacis]